jgi:glutathione S-transferase
MRTLYVLPYSPWSERARWALLHHRFEFTEQEHVPLVGELGLRKRARRWRGRATVPLLLDGQNPVMNSLAIAEYVDAMGSQPSLFPGELRAPIRALNARVEPTFLAARAWLSSSIDDASVLELVPSSLRKLPFAVTAAKLGTAFVARKHEVSFDDVVERMRAGFADIRALLAGRAYVHDAFTYADIICATALQFVAPVDDRFIPLGPATRRCWRHAALCEEFADLIAWRDQIYQRHRAL